MYDFLFLNMDVSYTLIFILFIYIYMYISESFTIYAFLWGNFMMFVLCAVLLYMHNLELIGSLLLISEVVVFFYIFLAITTSNINLFKVDISPVVFYAIVLFMFSLPLYHCFYHYILVDWFYTVYSPDNDVFGIYIYFFFLNWPLLIFLGILLLVVTYYICFFTIYFYTYLCKDRVKSNNSKTFFKKFQSKKAQISREPSFFTNSFFK